MAKKQSRSPVQKTAGWLEFLNGQIQYLNNSKIFAGLMIIILNIASKFVNIQLGKTVEAYLKYSFSKQILVFAIAWMGTRDIYVALVITILFFITTQVLFHEDSSFFILSQETKEHYCNLLDNPPDKVTQEDVKKARDILDRAEKQRAAAEEEKEKEGDRKSAPSIHARIEGTQYDSFYKTYSNA